VFPALPRGMDNPPRVNFAVLAMILLQPRALGAIM
jgi:hypothetical protein